MSQKKIKRKKPKAKDLKALRQRIQKAIVDTDDQLEKAEATEKVLAGDVEDFKDVT